MSQRSALARFLFESALFSNSANRRIWRTVVAAGAMLGSAQLVRPASADDQAGNPPAASVRVAQAAKPKPPVKMEPPMTHRPPPARFAKRVVDLGKVVAGSDATAKFIFSNQTKSDLTLSSDMVTSSCDCLAANVPTAAVKPGGKSTITVDFTAPTEKGPSANELILTFDRGTRMESTVTLVVKATIEPAPRPRGGRGVVRGRGFVLS